MPNVMYTTTAHLPKEVCYATTEGIKTHKNKENLSFCHSVQSIGHDTPYPFCPSV